MAGTRLAIQTMVIVQIIFVVIVSIHHGFCRSNCKRGNLTKDLPLVPGLSINSSGAIVQAQWWEDALCQPVTTIAGALFSDNESTPSTQQNTKDNSPNRDDIWSTKLDMTLAVENATRLPQWIDFVSKSLQENEGNNGASSFASILSLNPMGLEIISPFALDENESISATSIWSHYKRQSGKAKVFHGEPQERLVVYIPAWLSLDEETIEWKAFDVKASGEEKMTLTMLLPQNTTIQKDIPPSGRLQPLVEDWMARSILAQQKTNNEGTSPTDTRLTREFPIEHFLAVLMPLLFPLLLPFLVTWVKEYRRYKELIASKKAIGTETANADAQPRTKVPSEEIAE